MALDAESSDDVPPGARSWSLNDALAWHFGLRRLLRSRHLDRALSRAGHTGIGQSTDAVPSQLGLKRAERFDQRPAYEIAKTDIGKAQDPRSVTLGGPRLFEGSARLGG